LCAPHLERRLRAALPTVCRLHKMFGEGTSCNAASARFTPCRRCGPRRGLRGSLPGNLRPRFLFGVAGFRAHGVNTAALAALQEEINMSARMTTLFTRPGIIPSVSTARRAVKMAITSGQVAQDNRHLAPLLQVIER
jgi:hypothetical protein